MDDKTPPLQATSLDALPLAAQHFLAFGAIVTALGFPASAIDHRVIAATTIGSAPEGCCTRPRRRREFAIAVARDGGATPRAADVATGAAAELAP